jgi:hypothetical protein
MPRFACIFFVAFASTAASCSSELAQKEMDRKEMGRQLTAAYYSCVRTSFASQRPTMVDLNMAIDQALWSAEPKNRSFKHSTMLRSRPTAIR